MIPPQRNADFAAAMEQVLDVYHRPFDPAFPVVCMDETPRHLIGENAEWLAEVDAGDGAIFRDIDTPEALTGATS